jgi:hypothetical protein
MAAAVHFLDQMRELWRALKRGKPGERFRERYARAHRADRPCGAGQRILLFLAAIVCFGIGVVLSIFPGPAIPFFIIAGGLLATESLVIARWMDWGEVQARRLLAWGKTRWRRWPLPAKMGVALLAVCASLALSYTGLRLLRG